MKEGYGYNWRGADQKMVEEEQREDEEEQREDEEEQREDYMLVIYSE